MEDIKQCHQQINPESHILPKRLEHPKIFRGIFVIIKYLVGKTASRLKSPSTIYL